MLAPQDLALSILGAYLRKPGQMTWSGALVELLTDFGFSVEASRTALSRLVVRGMLERHREGRLVHYTVSPAGHDILAEGDRRFFTFGRSAPRGDAWTFVWHALPEDSRQDRSRFATRLRFLGFGPIQDATWVAVGDREPGVLRSAAAFQIEDYVTVFIGRISTGLDPAKMISTAWDLDRVEQRYRQFISEYRLYDERASRDALTATEAFVIRTTMVHRYRTFPTIDPELPEAHAPQVFSLRNEAVELFYEVYDGLQEMAEQRFDAVTGNHGV